MANSSTKVRKFERFLGVYNHDRTKVLPRPSEKDSVVLGTFEYDFENKTETYTPVENPWNEKK